MSVITGLRQLISEMEEDSAQMEISQLEKLEAFIKKQKTSETQPYIKYKTLADVRKANQYNYYLDFLKSLDKSIIKEWIERDHVEYSYNSRMVYNCCNLNKSNEHIIWLIEQGFFMDSMATVILADRGNLELLKYLHHKGFRIESIAPVHAIANGHLEILQYFYSNGAIDINYGYDITKDFMSVAFENNQVEILDYLRKGQNMKFDSFSYTKFKKIIESKKINNTTLLWAYNNEYKWTKDEAFTPFMLSFFE